MLYLMTNPKATQAGIYTLSKKVMAFETGFALSYVNELLDKFMYEYKHIIFNHDIQEVTLIASLSYSILKGGKPVTDCLNKDLDKVQDTSLMLATYQHMLEFWELSRRKYDKTVKGIFETHLAKRGILDFMNDNANDNDKEIDNENENENENDNDNEESSHDTSNDTSNDSYHPVDALTQLVREKLNLTDDVQARPITFTGEFTENELNAIKNFRGRLPDDVIQIALDRSVDKVNPIIYALKIMDNWTQAGVSDLDGVKRHDLNFQRSSNPNLF